MPGRGGGARVHCASLWIGLVLCADVALSYYSADQCSWRGSGLSQLQGSVEQISLHCSEGALDWLYPKGALRLSLAPRLPFVAVGPGAGGSGLVTVCVKASEQFYGAQLYLERDGLLELLLGDTGDTGDRDRPSARPQVKCFSRPPGQKVALFLQATPHQDISRRIASFRYELRGDWSAALSQDDIAARGEDVCRPCNNSELLMAVCTSDFVVRGNIRSVEDDETLRAAVISVSASRVFRQKYALFSGRGRLRGQIRTLLQCGVRPGPGSFLFTGRVHFGEAWLGCAPRYKDFREAYVEAKAAQRVPCELPVD